MWRGPHTSGGLGGFYLCLPAFVLVSWFDSGCRIPPRLQERSRPLPSLLVSFCAVLLPTLRPRCFQPSLLCLEEEMCITQKAVYLFFKFCLDGIGCLQPLRQLVLCLWRLKLMQSGPGCSDGPVILAESLDELVQLLLSDHLFISWLVPWPRRRSQLA